MCPAGVQMSLSSPSAASLCCLPSDVLSSCILPLLDAQSLLRFARCSHLCLSAADCAAAWVHSWMTGSIDRLTDADALRSLALRRARLSLDDGGWDRRSEVAQRLLSLPPTCKLMSLEIAGVRHDRLDWLIVAHPAMQHMQSLTLTGIIDIGAAHIRAVAGLPRLASLRVQGTVVAPGEFAAFAASTSLTSLDCSDGRSADGSQGTVLGCVLRCPTLRSLLLFNTAYPFTEGCSPLFALPGMERIRELTLSSMDAGAGCKPAPDEVASASPAALLSLHSLAIGVCYGIDNFLPHLRLAPVLRFVTIEQPPRCILSAIPSPAVLVGLLAAAPALSIRIRRFALDSRAYDAIATSLELQAFPTRFSMVE